MIFSTKGTRGPSSLARYIATAIEQWKKYSLKTIDIVHKNSLNMESFIVLAKLRNTYIWFEGSSFLYLINNSSYDSLFKRVIYGPIVSPISWFKVPLKGSYEEYWCKIMKKIKAYIVHSNRVKMHIINRTRCSEYENKYKILVPCIECKKKYIYVQDYIHRSIDFLVYIKYSDISKINEEKVLINYLKSKYIVKILRYGNFSKDTLYRYANTSKYVIYFSFYDTGALSLIEMKMMGVWPISHQREFIEDGYGSFIKNLDSNINMAFKDLDRLMLMTYSPYNLSQNVIHNLSCLKALYYTLKKIKF